MPVTAAQGLAVLPSPGAESRQRLQEPTAPSVSHFLSACQHGTATADNPLLFDELPCFSSPPLPVASLRILPSASHIKACLERSRQVEEKKPEQHTTQDCQHLPDDVWTRTVPACTQNVVPYLGLVIQDCCSRNLADPEEAPSFPVSRRQTCRHCKVSCCYLAKRGVH